MTIIIPGTIGKPSLERTILLDGVCLNYEQLFHTVQCIACRICQCSSIDELVLPRVTGILSISDQRHYLSGTKTFGNRTLQHSICLYQSGSLHILFSYQFTHTVFLPSSKFYLRQDISSFESVYSMSMAIDAFQLQLVQVFREKFSEL